MRVLSLNLYLQKTFIAIAPQDEEPHDTDTHLPAFLSVSSQKSLVSHYPQQNTWMLQSVKKLTSGLKHTFRWQLSGNKVETVTISKPSFH